MSATVPPRQFTMVPGQDIDALFLCPICQDSWADPVELVPCGDIFCQKCISAARAEHAAQPMIMENFQCPQCHTVVQSEKKPNRMLLNTVQEVEVECCYCHRRGTREASAQHECEEGKAQQLLEAAAGPLPKATASGASSALPSGHASSSSMAKADAPKLELSSSEAPLPARAHAPRRASASPPGDVAISSPPGLRGPRRAVQEIEGAFTAIEDDPTSTTFRTRAVATSGGLAASSNAGVSYDYGFGSVRSSGGVGGNSGGGGGAESRDQVLSSPLQPALGHTFVPSSSGPAGASNANNTAAPSFPSSEPWRRYRFSQLEYDQLVGIYMMFDEGTGKLNFQQLRTLCFCMNFVQHEEDVSVIFRAMDSSHKGYVTQDDFLLWLSTHRPDESALFGLSQFEYTDAVLQFRSVNPDFNGVIDANDFSALCMTNGYARTPEEAMRFFHMCDDRHTGYVSLQQYLRMLRVIKNGGHSAGGHSGGGGDGAAIGRVVGSSSASASAQTPGATHTPLRMAGSNSSGPSQVRNSTEASLGSATPQASDYWANEFPQAPPGRPPPSQSPPQQQPYSMVDFFSPASGTNNNNWNYNYAGGGGAATRDSQQQQQRGQRFVTSLNSYPAELGQLQNSSQQQQQQPYSQMSRSTMPVNPQTSTQPVQVAQQPRSRLHRPSVRPQRDEECAMM